MRICLFSFLFFSLNASPGIQTFTNLTFGQNSNFLCEIAESNWLPTPNDKLIITNTCTIDPTATISIVPWPNPGIVSKLPSYTIIDAGTIDGAFLVDPLPPEFSEYVLSYETVGSRQYLYFKLPPPPPPPPEPKLFNSYPGNPGSTAKLNNQNNGNTTIENQAMIDASYSPDIQTQFLNLRETSPQFKIIQYSQDKLDLLVHKEISDQLYTKKDRNKTFLFSGYDNLNQKPKGQYSGSKLFNGYNIDSYYQFLGYSNSFSYVKTLIAVGAAEIYANLFPGSARANYPTIYTSLGLSSEYKNFIIGFDGLFGYSFIHSKRQITLINETASSNHGAWTASVLAKAAYRIHFNKIDLTPYDNISYLFGHENTYRESGAPGANFQVKDENLSVIRNELGVKLDKMINNSFSLFLDCSWLFEKFINSASFKAAFVGTNNYGVFIQPTPTNNYGRLSAGFCGSYKHLEWMMKYTGLFGNKYSENALSLKFGYKF